MPSVIYQAREQNPLSEFIGGQERTTGEEVCRKREGEWVESVFQDHLQRSSIHIGVYLATPGIRIDYVTTIGMKYVGCRPWSD